MRIDDAPLPHSNPGDARSAWIWKPDFYAGQVNAELVDRDGRIVANFRLDVSPNPNKLGREVFDSMVEKIRRWAPELILGSEPARTWAGTQGGFQNPFVQYARLRANAGEFLAAMSGVAQKPLRELRRQRRLVRPESVQRTDITTALTAMRSPEDSIHQCMLTSPVGGGHIRCQLSVATSRSSCRRTAVAGGILPGRQEFAAGWQYHSARSMTRVEALLQYRGKAFRRPGTLRVLLQKGLRVGFDPRGIGDCSRQYRQHACSS